MRTAGRDPRILNLALAIIEISAQLPPDERARVLTAALSDDDSLEILGREGDVAYIRVAEYTFAIPVLQLLRPIDAETPMTN